MKFGKAFKKQKVPEWTEAYLDYNGLKHILQEIRRLKQNKQPTTPSEAVYERAFSGLNRQASSVCKTRDVENQVINVNEVHQQNSRKLYNTEFLLSPEGGGGRENEITYFQKLDDELNKVNSFYKDKVEEVTKEAASLNKQMDVLIALRIKVMHVYLHVSSSSKRLSENAGDSSVSKICSPSQAGTSETESNDLASEVELQWSNHGQMAGRSLRGKENIREYQPPSLEILDRVKITSTFESPMLTIKGVLMDQKEKALSFNKEELKEVEEKLKQAFSEFYQKLQLLKNYSFMNLSAFSKILKKYEKITSRAAARSYMRMMDNSYLGSSDEVNGLLDKAEATFIKHFTNSNRREGMKFLRAKHKTEKHRITFFSGFFSGFAIALLIAMILLIKAKRLIDKQEGQLYITNIFPLYSFYVYIVLHTLLYAANVYFWKCYKINYPFIFGFKQGTELGYRDVFLLGSGLSMLALATFLVHLHMKLDSGSQDERKYVDYVPLGLIIVVIAIMLCPCNIIYHSSRFFLIKCVFRCVCSPFYEVTLPDFFVADQLTSQCVRRLCGDRDFVHGYNSLRYFSTIIAVVIRTTFELRKTWSLKVLALVSLAAATFINIYWDIVMDWGILQRKSKNLFLRQKLVIMHKSIYFAAMVLDVLLRFAWLQLLFPIDLQSLRGNTISTIFACLEILRRGMWNFFRLENEHLNNVGKFRAFKSVPLPFSYNDESDENDEKDD